MSGWTAQAAYQNKDGNYPQADPMVAGVVMAMASHRPYRPALGIDKALDCQIETLRPRVIGCLQDFHRQDLIILKPVRVADAMSRKPRRSSDLRSS
jgi:hypothetical protein